MTKYSIVLFALMMLAISCNAENKNGTPATDVKISSTMDTVSYILGVNLGTQLSSDSLVPNIDAVAMGIKDAIDKKIKIDDKTREAIIQSFVAQLQEKAMKKQEAELAKLKADAPKNLAEGKKFLEENKSKPGVQTSTTGLQYKIINPGTGAKPKPTDQVTVHYKGTLVNGTVFDNSFERGQPSTFQLNGVIPGWTEGLQLIGQGGKMILYIPHELAYGEEGRPPVIPPSSVLIFEVELVKIGK